MWTFGDICQPHLVFPAMQFVIGHLSVDSGMILSRYNKKKFRKSFITFSAAR